jgi:hypothetical protein
MRRFARRQSTKSGLSRHRFPSGSRIFTMNRLVARGAAIAPRRPWRGPAEDDRPRSSPLPDNRDRRERVEHAAEVTLAALDVVPLGGVYAREIGHSVVRLKTGGPDPSGTHRVVRQRVDGEWYLAADAANSSVQSVIWTRWNAVLGKHPMTTLIGSIPSLRREHSLASPRKSILISSYG